MFDHEAEDKYIDAAGASEAITMYWRKLNEQDRLSLAYDIYRGALSVTDAAGAWRVCHETIERAGASADEAKQIAQKTHEWYAEISATIDAQK